MKLKKIKLEDGREQYINIDYIEMLKPDTNPDFTRIYMHDRGNQQVCYVVEGQFDIVAMNLRT